jgi:predicted secreted protein
MNIVNWKIIATSVFGHFNFGESNFGLSNENRHQIEDGSAERACLEIETYACGTG